MQHPGIADEQPYLASLTLFRDVIANDDRSEKINNDRKNMKFLSGLSENFEFHIKINDHYVNFSSEAWLPANLETKSIKFVE